MNIHFTLLIYLHDMYIHFVSLVASIYHRIMDNAIFFSDFLNNIFRSHNNFNNLCIENKKQNIIHITEKKSINKYRNAYCFLNYLETRLVNTTSQGRRSTFFLGGGG